VNDETIVRLNLEAGALTLGNVLDNIGALVDYARSKNAPDTAIIRIETSMVSLRDGLLALPHPYRHTAEIAWTEPASIKEEGAQE
jgi:hypothetical protein